MLPTSLTAAHHTTTSHASSKEPHRSAAIQLANRTGRTAHEKQRRDGNPSIERPPMQAGKVLITLQRYSLLTRDLRPTSALVGHYLCLRLLLLASFWAEVPGLSSLVRVWPTSLEGHRTRSVRCHPAINFCCKSPSQNNLPCELQRS